LASDDNSAALVTAILNTLVFDDASDDEEVIAARAILLHGTSVASALSLLNGASLSLPAALANKIDGPPGFFLATHPDSAPFFAVRRAPGTILQAAPYSVPSREGISRPRFPGRSL
jgi:hypothetical protein